MGSSDLFGQVPGFSLRKLKGESGLQMQFEMKAEDK